MANIWVLYLSHFPSTSQSSHIHFEPLYSEDWLYHARISFVFRFRTLNTGLFLRHENMYKSHSGPLKCNPNYLRQTLLPSS